MTAAGFIAIVLFLFLPFFIAWLLVRMPLDRARQTIAQMEERLGPIPSLDAEVSKLTKEIADHTSKVQEAEATHQKYQEKNKHLESQIAIYDEKLAFAAMGVYEPHFDYTDSEAYKTRICAIREKQKALISSGKATECPKGWSLDGSEAKGAAMIKRQTSLTMRAFNNECDASIANARWNNVNAMEKRILSSAKAINQANASFGITITDRYVALKISELFLVHGCREQEKVEKDQRIEIARAQREEKKLRDELAAAEQEEARFQKLLDKAKSAAGVDAARIAELEASLDAAQAEKERARSMAEMTKTGYVYIISNIGSFGEGVVKIGMTRRTDPDDRVRELSGASVPFSFDTHAMIYSDDAPALEAALHREFSQHRVNMANLRKEFFRVTLDSVEQTVARLASSAQFFKDTEAQEWRETLARRNLALAALDAPTAQA